MSKTGCVKTKKRGGFARQNFLDYYKNQQIVPPGEWDTFVSILDQPLPACFRINYNCAYPERLRTRLRNEFQFDAGKYEFQGQKVGPPMELPWYPDSCGWKLSCGRAALRKLGKTEPVLHGLHKFLIAEVDTGNISRQEAVSMVPPLMLGVQPHHLVLDMCAAPGSKTAQIVEQMTHTANQKGGQIEGMVVANDINAKRAYLLAHQLARVHCQALVITGHDASEFPELADQSQTGQGFFDRVLCDVPCAGDGTIRKSPEILRKWHPGTGLTLHSVQLAIARRGATVLKVGGTMVYSTCSLNPMENEESKGALEVKAMGHACQGLIRRPGLQSWKVGWARKGGKHLSDTRESGQAQQMTWFSSIEEIPDKLDQRIYPSMFPPSEDHIKSQLLNCMRFLPHDQDTGGFFVTVIQKVAPVPQSMTVTPSAAAAAIKAAKAAKLSAEAATANDAGILDGAGAISCPRTRTKYTSFGVSTVPKAKDAESTSVEGPAAKKQKLCANDQQGKQQNRNKEKKAKKSKNGSPETDEYGFKCHEYRPLSHTQWEHVRRYFGLTDGLKRPCLFSRSAGTATVWLVSDTVAKHCLRTSGTPPPGPTAAGSAATSSSEPELHLKVVQTGTRLFARTTEKGGRTTQAKAIRLQQKDAERLAGPNCRIGADFLEEELNGTDDELPVCFRPAQEGLQILLPHMTKRVVKLGLKDFLQLLKNAASTSNAKQIKDKGKGAKEDSNQQKSDQQDESSTAIAQQAQLPTKMDSSSNTSQESGTGAAPRNQRSFVAIDTLDAGAELQTLAVGPVVVILSADCSTLKSSEDANATSENAKIQRLHAKLAGKGPSTELALSLWVGTNKVNVLVSKLLAEVLLTSIAAVLEQENSTGK